MKLRTLSSCLLITASLGFTACESTLTDNALISIAGLIQYADDDARAAAGLNGELCYHIVRNNDNEGPLDEGCLPIGTSTDGTFYAEIAAPYLGSYKTFGNRNKASGDVVGFSHYIKLNGYEGLISGALVNKEENEHNDRAYTFVYAIDASATPSTSEEQALDRTDSILMEVALDEESGELRVNEGDYRVYRRPELEATSSKIHSLEEFDVLMNSTEEDLSI